MRVFTFCCLLRFSPVLLSYNEWNDNSSDANKQFTLLTVRLYQVNKGNRPILIC